MESAARVCPGRRSCLRGATCRPHSTRRARRSSSAAAPGDAQVYFPRPGYERLRPGRGRQGRRGAWDRGRAAGRGRGRNAELLGGRRRPGALSRRDVDDRVRRRVRRTATRKSTSSASSRFSAVLSKIYSRAIEIYAAMGAGPHEAEARLPGGGACGRRRRSRLQGARTRARFLMQRPRGAARPRGREAPRGSDEQIGSKPPSPPGLAGAVRRLWRRPRAAPAPAMAAETGATRTTPKPSAREGLPEEHHFRRRWKTWLREPQVRKAGHRGRAAPTGRRPAGRPCPRRRRRSGTRGRRHSPPAGDGHLGGNVTRSEEDPGSDAQGGRSSDRARERRVMQGVPPAAEAASQTPTQV